TNNSVICSFPPSSHSPYTCISFVPTQLRWARNYISAYGAGAAEQNNNHITTERCTPNRPLQWTYLDGGRHHHYYHSALLAAFFMASRLRLGGDFYKYSSTNNIGTWRSILQHGPHPWKFFRRPKISR
ncbi:unnamed protein product, partial [Ectocarpus fasciculatus]